LAGPAAPCDGRPVPRSRAALYQRALPLLVIATAAVSAPVMIFSPRGLDRLSALKDERVRADDEVRRLTREIERLRAEVLRIKEDPAAIERVARDEMGLVRQTEVVFQFRP